LIVRHEQMHLDTSSADFIAIGSNATPCAVDYHPVDGRLAFAAGQLVAVTRAGECAIHYTLKGHSDEVNVVRWWKLNEDIYLLSGGVDKTLRIWKDQEEICNICCNSSVNVITVLESKDIYCIGTAAGTIELFQFPNNHLSTISTTPLYPLAIALALLPGSPTDILLAVGGSSVNISLYTGSSSDRCIFKLQATLRGHEDWIRSLAFKITPTHLVMASASQDKYIRLWHVRPRVSHKETGIVDEGVLENRSYRLDIAGSESKFEAAFEALLTGHDDWITSVFWHPRQKCLLSASADSSVCVWASDISSGIWTTCARLGDINDVKGTTSATGGGGGFWQAIWGPEGLRVACLGKNGSIRRWESDTDDLQTWRQIEGSSGHVRAVSGLSWDPQGAYLISTSLDQTTRLYAELETVGSGRWKEISRPQIHGYDINSIASLTSTCFVSGADEKVVRVFSLPGTVRNLLKRLNGLSIHSGDVATSANVPLLGLSNKAADGQLSGVDILRELQQAPFEEHLARHTLWPEREKIYGHGYEIRAVACSHDFKYMASACKANSLDHAGIRIYDTSSWKELALLKVHALTVQRLVFSPDNERLLSVGRDRQWAVFRVRDGEFALEACQNKAHARIIHDACWLSNKAFATASRDKTFKVWDADEKPEWTCIAEVKLDAPVTAVAVRVQASEIEETHLAVGLENSSILLYTATNQKEWHLTCTWPQKSTPGGRINQLAWRPNSTCLAVASEDCSVRIYNTT